MFTRNFNLTITAILILTSSCTSLNSTQERELKGWQAKNLEVKEKNPTTAAVLNILPGIGDFYNGNTGYGIANLLAWPLSILWAPVGGADGANEVNYYASKAHVEELENKRKKLKNEIEIAFIGKQINKQEFLVAHKKVDSMNLIEFQEQIELKDIIPHNGYSSDNDRIPTSAKN